MKFTAIPYGYCDAANFKAFETVYVSGSLTEKDILTIQEKLEDGEMFIPTQVGMKSLQSTMPDFPSEDDHVWHTFTERFSETEQIPEGTLVLCSAAELVARFTKVDWDVYSEVERLGI